MKPPNESAAGAARESIKSEGAEGSQFIVKRIGPQLERSMKLGGADQIRDLWRDSVASRECFDSSKEHLVVVALDCRDQFLGWHLVTTGTANSAHAGPRDVLRAALMIDASSIVLVHNHPSGNVIPSRHDELFTRIIGEACVTVGVELLNHVVVDSEGARSHSMRGSHPQMFHRVYAPPGGAPPGNQPHAGRERDVLVNVTIPRAFTKGVAWKVLYDALSSQVDATSERDWIQRWTKGRSLKKAHKRAAQLKQQHTHEFPLNSAHFERVKRAAAAIGETPEALLVAQAQEICSSLRTWEKVANANAPTAAGTSKIVPFFRGKP